jgi:membrane associated rhomboid family serine protease
VVLFALQVYVAIRTGRSIEYGAVVTLAALYEIEYVLAPFLHGGHGHFTANLVLLAAYGSLVEPELEQRTYALFVIVSAYVGIIVTQQRIVGISGTVFALGSFYGVFAVRCGHWRAIFQADSFGRGVTAFAATIGGLVVPIYAVATHFSLLSSGEQVLTLGHLLGAVTGLAAYLLFDYWEIVESADS